jgi:hypothetical protein
MTNPDFAVCNVVISWPYAFASEQTVGLYVLDISDPGNITVVSTCETPGTAIWIAGPDDHSLVYVADYEGGLRVIDVSDPTAPHEVGFYKQNVEKATYVTAKGTSVYVADGGAVGFHVINVSDPTEPIEVAYHQTPGAYAHGIAMAEEAVYALDLTHLGIYEVSNGSPGNEDDPVPDVSVYRIHTVCPNPVISSAEIYFDLPTSGRTLLQLYAINGQQVQTLLNGAYPAGRHVALFQAETIARGVYLLRLDANGQTDSRIVTLVK